MVSWVNLVAGVVRISLEPRLRSVEETELEPVPRVEEPAVNRR
jgi:hypothetical protein